jgi:membrane protein YqaA with SNARE-associated domain
MNDTAQSAAPGAVPASPDAGKPAKGKGGGPFRAIYNWVLRMAGGKHAQPSLFAVSFAESSFFPIPPDVMLMPMVLARPNRAYRFALVCTIGSILGALFGYWIGSALYDSVGKSIVAFFGYAGKEAELRAVYTGDSNQFLSPAFWVIMIKGLTPVPFKLVTIVSGFMKMNPLAFVVACAVTRGIRFFVVAFVFKTFGPTLAPIIEKRIGLFMLAAAVIIIAGFFVAAMLH